MAEAPSDGADHVQPGKIVIHQYSWPHVTAMAEGPLHTADRVWPGEIPTDQYPAPWIQP